MIDAICSLPRQLAPVRQSAIELVRRAGLSAAALPTLVPALAAHLDASPDLVKLWLAYSETRWPAEGHWYLRVETGPLYHVFHRPPVGGRTYVYPSLTRACAEFIVRELTASLRVVVDHRVRIIWSVAQVGCGLPTFTDTTDKAWVEDALPPSQGWHLVCHFDQSPRAQGNPSVARVHFLVDDAPHDRLVAGARLRMHQASTTDHAIVEVLD